VLLSAAEPIWSLPLAQVPPALQSRPTGLSQEEAERRLARWGPNRLPPLRRRSLALRLLDQMVHFMALLLWVAGGMAFAAGTPELGWAIWAVVLINGMFSFWQEFQAERTLVALTRSLPSQVQVWRDGALRRLPADQLVPGDRIQLEEGDRIPADCRVGVAASLYLDLSVLTGESLPVARQAEPLPAPDPRPNGGPSGHPRVATHERANLVLAGCSVASGRGEAFVYATGAETEFGQVAHLAAGTQRAASTLEQQVGRIVQTITVLSLSMGALAFALSFLFVGMGPLESLVFAIGIIVANVPEGLLPTVTLALIVAGQMGALLACRSDRQPFWTTLRRPNRLLWLGFLSEPLVAGSLILVPALAAVFRMAPFPSRWLLPMLGATLLVLGADTLHKRLRPAAPAAAPVATARG
jgi:magnesium-transporting ATPase (P-type)